MSVYTFICEPNHFFTDYACRIHTNPSKYRQSKNFSFVSRALQNVSATLGKHRLCFNNCWFLERPKLFMSLGFKIRYRFNGVFSDTSYCEFLADWNLSTNMKRTVVLNWIQKLKMLWTLDRSISLKIHVISLIAEKKRVMVAISNTPLPSPSHTHTLKPEFIISAPHGS